MTISERWGIGICTATQFLDNSSHIKCENVLLYRQVRRMTSVFITWRWPLRFHSSTDRWLPHTPKRHMLIHWYPLVLVTELPWMPKPEGANVPYIKWHSQAGKMAQQVKVLSTKMEDMSLIPELHMVERDFYWFLKSLKFVFWSPHLHTFVPMVSLSLFLSYTHI